MILSRIYAKLALGLRSPFAARSSTERTFDNLKAMQRLVQGGTEAFKRYPGLQQKVNDFLGSGRGSGGAFFMNGANGAVWATKALMQAVGLGPVGMTVMSLAAVVTTGIAIAACLHPDVRVMLEADLVRVSTYLEAGYIRTRTYLRAKLGVRLTGIPTRPRGR
jgi:hypothetical protein